MQLDIALNPDDLEAEADELRLLRGTGFSHVALAESLWNEMYGDSGDPALLGFADEQKRDRSFPAEIWRSFQREWYELACTPSTKYRSLRGRITSLKGSPATVVVSAISAAIGATLGLAPAVLVPFIAIFLHGSLTVGNNVVCRAMAARIGKDNEPS